MFNYMKMKINPYASEAKLMADLQHVAPQTSLENSIKGAMTVLGENYTDANTTVYTAESFRVFWSDVNVLFLRASTGFINGLFENTNSTKCGSRLIQMNTLFNNMLAKIDELDPFLKELADFSATTGYMCFHCYFMGKDVMTDLVETTMKYIEIYGDDEIAGTNPLGIWFFNFLWAQTDIVNNFRAFQIITSSRIYTKNLEPTNRLQKDLYQQWQYLGRVFKHILAVRTNTNYSGYYDIDYKN